MLQFFMLHTLFVYKRCADQQSLIPRPMWTGNKTGGVWLWSTVCNRCAKFSLIPRIVLTGSETFCDGVTE